MARTLTAPMLAAVAGQLTRPGYFVQISWSTVVRLSTRGDRTWNGQTWSGGVLTVKGISWERDGGQKASLALSNHSGAYGVVALSEGVADVPVKIWIFDAAAVATGDPVLVFDGVGDKCDISPASIEVDLVTQKSTTAFSPRGYISRESGYSIVPAAGSTINWGGQTYRLERRR